jgi:CRISPR/Cas system-associated endonuclease Cas3-HD
MEDHIETMLKKYRSLDGGIKTSIRKAYEIYVKAASSINGRILENSKPFIECDPVELVIAFHDLGKCTGKNQESLRKNCTAPYHEVVSAASLYALSISIDKDFGFISVLPHIMAILLHHHSMRSIEDILDTACKSKLYWDNDSQNIAECVKISLKVDCPDLRQYIASSTWISHISRSISEISKVIRLIRSLRGVRGQGAIIPYFVYRSAVMIAGVISILDRYAASINRSCGRVSEEDIDRDVREYIRRRQAFMEASRSLSIGGG